jgi:PAS domain S-box-containing protein
VKGRQFVHLMGVLFVLLIAAAAVWIIARDRAAALEQSRLHLDNVAIVHAEHTRLALLGGDPLLAAVAQSLRGSTVSPAVFKDEQFQRRLAELYGSLGHAYTGRVFLFDEGGTLVTVFPPHAENVGFNYADHPLFRRGLTAAERGAIEAQAFLEPDQRLIAYHRVHDFPLLVAVSSPMSHVLAQWWRAAFVTALGGLLFAAVGGLGAYALGRELARTEALARGIGESESRLGSIVNSAMDAVITVDEQQRIVLFNEAAERIFGLPRSEALGASLERFIPGRYRAAHRDHIRRFGEAGVTVRRMGPQVVLSGLRADGEEFPIEASISHVTVQGHKFFTVILRDVTARERALEEQRAAHQQLLESRQRLQSIIDSAMDAIITADEEQRIVLFNVAAERIFRRAHSKAVGQPLEVLLPERYREAHRAHVSRFGEAGTTMRRMGGELVLSGLRSDGEEFPIDASISHTTLGGHKFYTVILRDVSERQRSAEALRRSHEELRELYEAMHQVREAERTRIARELHDELAQWLTALKMDVSWLGQRLPPTDERLATRVQKMKEVVDSTVAAVRRIAAALRPVMLDDLGLRAAIEQLLNDLAERGGMQVSLEGSDADADLKEPLATAVYRMVQEALTNVARHSGATAVAVQLKRESGRLRIVVRDNGRGLKPDPDRKSYGLLGIRERARTLGGSAQIYSPPEGGTIVEIDVPVEHVATAGLAA